VGQLLVEKVRYPPLPVKVTRLLVMTEAGTTPVMVVVVAAGLIEILVRVEKPEKY
jgi:hypothetical protein